MHKLFSGYRQFYVIDYGKNPPAPEDWTDEDISLRAKVADGIAVLCPQNDIVARVNLSVELPHGDDGAQFVVQCPLTISVGPLALVGWPDVVAETHAIRPGEYIVEFRGYDLESNGEHYHVWVYPGHIGNIEKLKDVA